MIPDFAVLGSPRSGTSWLMTVLSSHTQIDMPLQELPYLENPEYLSGGIELMNRSFSDPAYTLRGFKRAGYIFHPYAGERLGLHYPNLKIIIIARDPVSRVLSSYFHHMRFGYIPMLPPNRGIPHLVHGSFQKEYPRSIELLNHGFYGDAIHRLMKYFDASQIHFIDQSLVKKDPTQVLEKLFNFLKIPYENLQLRNKVHNAGVYSVPTLHLERFHNRFYYVHSKDKMRLHPPKPGGFKNWFCRKLRIFNYRVLQKLVSNIKPNLNQECRQMIRDYYQYDMELLAKICAKNEWITPNWCKSYQ